MKENELMVGDWVYGCTDPYSPDEEQKKFPVKVIRIDLDGDIYTMGQNPSDDPYDDEWWNIEPIPITPEILEKNFEKREVRILVGTKTHYCLGNDYFDLAVSEYTDSIWEVEYTNCEAHFPLIRNLVGYVHELQHALRLCGITREITI